MEAKELIPILKNLKKETKQLKKQLIAKYENRYRIGVNGLGVIVLGDLKRCETIAYGEKECQEKMVELLSK